MRSSLEVRMLRGRKRRDRLQIAIIINQLATPGLGTWMAGRRVAGAGQLVLACIGFVLIVMFLGLIIINTIRSAETGLEAPLPPANWWQWGMIFFGIAWIWAGFSSIQMWMELRAQRRSTQVPPPLS